MFEVVTKGKRFFCTKEFSIAVASLLKGAGEMMKPGVTTRREVNRKNFIAHQIPTEYGQRLYIMWFYEVWKFSDHVGLWIKTSPEPEITLIDEAFLKMGREAVFVSPNSKLLQDLKKYETHQRTGSV